LSISLLLEAVVVVRVFIRQAQFITVDFTRAVAVVLVATETRFLVKQAVVVLLPKVQFP
jgi:hypothetical protein